MTRKSDADGIRANALHAGPPPFLMKRKDAAYISMSVVAGAFRYTARVKLGRAVRYFVRIWRRTRSKGVYAETRHTDLHAGGTLGALARFGRTLPIA